MQNQNEFVQISRVKQFSQNDFLDLISVLNQKKQQSIAPPQIPVEELPSSVDKNLITPQNEPVPDCLKCGACCTFLLCLTVNLSDLTPADQFWEITLETSKNKIVVDRFLRRDKETLACAALAGKLGESVRCQIYEKRPAVCREFEAGSDKCHGVRRAYGIEPGLSEDTLREAQFRLELYKERQLTIYQIVYAQIIALDEPIDNKDRAILVLFKNETSQIIHLYSSNQEVYFQSEFINLNITEAFELINSRQRIQIKISDNSFQI